MEAMADLDPYRVRGDCPKCGQPGEHSSQYAQCPDERCEHTEFLMRVCATCRYQWNQAIPKEAIAWHKAEDTAAVADEHLRRGHKAL
jgi:hypothetical protein